MSGDSITYEDIERARELMDKQALPEGYSPRFIIKDTANDKLLHSWIPADASRIAEIFEALEK